MKIRTGFFGGSFNPIHLGHVALAKEMLRVGLLDEVWFVVSPQNPLKADRTQVAERLRLQMVELALQDQADMRACDVELHLPKPSYTWKTLAHLQATHPERAFILIIGADNWQVFHRWAHYETLLAHHNIIVYPRAGYAIDMAALPTGVTYLDAPLYPVSSTHIRQALAQEEDVSAFVDKRVQAFISAHRLYEAE